MDPNDELRRAREKLGRAETLSQEMPSLAGQQAYLAMFAAARARIALDREHMPKTHKGVQDTLYLIYREAGSPQNPAIDLHRAYSLKQDDDYGGDQIGPEDALRAVATARGFIETMAADIATRAVTAITKGPAIADADDMTREILQRAVASSKHR